MVYQDVIRPRKDVRTYRVNFLLWKEQWDAYIAPPIPLNWKCVKFEENSAAQIPTEKGIYAFARNLLLYMLDHPLKDVERLRGDYAKALGLKANEVELPKKVL